MPPELEAAARALFAFQAVPDPPGPVDLPADLIVCLGSYDTRVAIHAAGLARRHPAARVICTGRDGNWTRGRWPATEAEVFAGILQDHGVPRHRITLEPHATHIGENIAFARALSAGWQVAQAVFVTKPQTILRVRHTLPVQWPGLAARVDAPPLGFDAYVTDADFRHRLVNEMVGDIDRLIAYPALGFQTPCEVPDSIRAARDLLKARGFTEHALP